MAKDFEQVVIKCTMNWVCFNIPNKKSGKFQVECCELSAEDQAKLKKIGLGDRVRVKDGKPEYGTFITVKSNIKAEQYRDDDTDLRWFDVTYPDRMAVDLNKIGNGTEAFVKIDAVPYDNDFGKGVKADLNTVVVTKLVEYEGGDNNDDIYEAAGNLPELAEDAPQGDGDGWDSDEDVPV